MRQAQCGAVCVVSGGFGGGVDDLSSLKIPAILPKKLFFFCGSAFCWILTVRGVRGREHFRASAEEAGEESGHPSLLIASLAGLGAGHEGGRVVVGAVRGSQAVGGFIQLHVDHAGGLGKRFHVGILRQRCGLLHELGPDRRGRHARR